MSFVKKNVKPLTFLVLFELVLKGCLVYLHVSALHLPVLLHEPLLIIRLVSAGPDPAVFFSAGPDPAVFFMRIRIQLTNL